MKIVIGLLMVIVFVGCSSPQKVRNPELVKELRGYIRPNKAKYSVNEPISVNYWLNNVSGKKLSEQVVDGSKKKGQAFLSYTFNATSLDEKQNPLKLVKAGEPFHGLLELKPKEEKLFVTNEFIAEKKGSYLLTIDLNWRNGKKITFKPITLYVIKDKVKVGPLIAPDLEKALTQLTATDPVVRSQAKQVVKEYGAAATPHLVNLMGNRDPKLRAEAMFLLVQMKDISVPALLQGAQHFNREIRMRSIYALGEIGDERALPIFGNAVTKDPDKEVRLTCLRIISDTFIDKIAIPIMIQVLADPSLQIRQNTIKNLRDRTEKDFGYKADGDEKQRKETIEKWRNWWQQNNS